MVVYAREHEINHRRNPGNNIQRNYNNRFQAQSHAPAHMFPTPGVSQTGTETDNNWPGFQNQSPNVQQYSYETHQVPNIPFAAYAVPMHSQNVGSVTQPNYPVSSNQNAASNVPRVPMPPQNR